MKNIKLLDCTLRDGGYVNDWEFGKDTITSVFERLVGTGVDIIEIGFLDERRDFDPNRTIMPNTESVEKIYGKIDKKNAMIVGMIDYGTCGIENIQPCQESYLDGIRVIFKKHLMHEALEFCRQIKELGYKVFTQAVSITSYDEEELLKLIGLVNEVQPYAVSMVDTYGLLHQDNLMRIFKMMDAHLSPEIGLGYHSHNNFQMAYANCIEILNTPVERMVLIDGTLYGLGKSAGNAPLELLGMYMNENCGKAYDISQMLEAIEINIMDIYRKVQWGYNLFYYVAASTKCHPNYVSYLMNKKTLSIKSITEILKSIPEDVKLLYDQKMIETLYLEYQKTECDDADAMERLKRELVGQDLLILGPGKSIQNEAEAIGRYVREYRPIIITINYIPEDYETDYVFLSNAKRYVQLSSKLNCEEHRGIRIIATSNVTKTQGMFDYELNYSALIDPKADIPDNSLIMLLKMLIRAGVSQCALAGFDGYSEKEMNYFNTNMEYSFAKEKAEYLNQYTKKFIGEAANQLAISFVTKTHYQNT